MTLVNEPGQTTLENRIRIRPMTWSHVYRDHWGTHVMAMESLSEHERLDIEATSTVERTPVEHHEPSLDWVGTVQDPAVQDRKHEWLMLSPRTAPEPGSPTSPRPCAAPDAAPPPRSCAASCAGDALRARHHRCAQPRRGRLGRTGRCLPGLRPHHRRGAAQPRGTGPLRVGLPRAQRDVTVGETSTGESHAWVEFWDNEWVACDPTNGTDVGSDHTSSPAAATTRTSRRSRASTRGPRHASLEVSVAITRLA